MITDRKEADFSPPFFVIDGQDVMFCRSLAHLERFVEPVDAPFTKAYDAIGRVIELRAIAVEPREQGRLAKLFPGREVTRAVPTSVSDSETLEKALKMFLQPVNPEVGHYRLADIVANLDRFGVHYS